MKNIYSAGVVTYIKEGDTIEYLLLKYLGGHWDFPKGKLEAGENKFQAAVRELAEETGLTAEIYPGFESSYAYAFKDKARQPVSKTVYFFVGKANQRAVKLSEEHKQYKWLDYEQALYLLSYENAKGVLAKADMFLHSQGV
jgi:bis(5'-nucleosidyl)-tetraphosphatase